MAEDNTLGLKTDQKIDSVEDFKFERQPIKGYPELNWRGKRPFTSTQFYPAQLKEQHGEEVNGWLNKVFWGDNLQVMSHLLKTYRGQVDLIYIDPPFDSKADYKKKISLKGKDVQSDQTSFEEKQYTDIWNNDDYLQFMYERLIILRELLATTGTLFLHCDWHKSHYLRCLLDEVFGSSNFRNEIIWKRKGGSANPNSQFDTSVDTILFYSKTENYNFFGQFTKDTVEAKKYMEERFNSIDENGRNFLKSPIVSPNYRENLIYEYKGFSPPKNGWSISKDLMEKWDAEGKLYFPDNGDRIYRKIYIDEYKGQPITNLWTDIFVINPVANERLNYPTQKPEALLTRIIQTVTQPDDLVFDCFMGSGTTQSVAMKLGRKFIGADINLGAIQTTTKRLINVAKEIQSKPPQLEFDTEDGKSKVESFYTGFQVYNVNHYDIFRNPVQAKELLIKALEIQLLPNNALYDGEKDGRMVKIMPVNRIATRADLNELVTGFDYKTFEKRNEDNPGKPVEFLTLVCMGHEPDLAAALQKQMPYKLDIEVVDILRDKSNLEFKRDSEAEIITKDGKLLIEQFYPMNLLQKLSIMKENVEDWKELTESVMIDFNYDGAVFEPQVVDVPPKDELVKGEYKIPTDSGTIKVKITDLLSESLEILIND
ncbi:MAG: site-specific DNA-methyltransferase [Fulvivirga sp.]